MNVIRNNTASMVRRSRIASMLAFFTVALILGVASVSVRADFDTDITGVVTSATNFFTSIKTLLITVVGFGIALTYMKFAKKK